MTDSKPGLVKVAVEGSVDDLEMGVTEEGEAYLTARGLARLCGVAPSSVITQGRQWLDGRREGRLARLLQERGVSTPSLYTLLPNGNHAYPDTVCMVFLEYYALEAKPSSEQALMAFRKLAHAGLRLFIFSALGWDPSKRVPELWRKFHDRLMLNTTPRGYFSVFSEMSHLVITAIQAGLEVDERTIPDISVGRTWSSRWTKDRLAEVYGERAKWPHTYPDYFPQSEADVEAWVYPVASLPAFREWLQTEYIGEKLSQYLKRKVTQKQLPPSVAELILEAFAPKELAP